VEYDPGAESPEAWIDFLSVIWPGDDGIACAHLLAEWMGYVISNSMAHHKMLWLIGPPRSGKGTIARILRNLIAPGDSCAPTLCSLSDPRGATCMIDKQSAIIGDARLDDRNNNKAAITERLLSVSGGDQQTIPRKYLADWNGELTVKITLLSNEPPNLTDASGALASRLLMLRMTESFVGREDLTLADRLENELPGILNWCIDGLTRLRLRGKFTEPESSKALSRSFRAMSSPLSSFVEDRCIVSPAEYVTKNDIYEDYQKWCEEEGISHPMGKPKFGYSLQSVVPKIGTRQATCAGRRQWQYTGIRLKSGQAKFRTF
jgi:putative DNA primase/helicase